MSAHLSLRHRSFAYLTRHLSSSPFSTAATTSKIPTLYEPTAATTTQDDDAPTTTLQLLSWGRGASGQLGGGIEENRLYPTPVANLVVPTSSFTLSSSQGRIQTPNCSNQESNADRSIVEVGISCGLFHSSLLVTAVDFVLDMRILCFCHFEPEFGFGSLCGAWRVAFGGAHRHRRSLYMVGTIDALHCILLIAIQFSFLLLFLICKNIDCFDLTEGGSFVSNSRGYGGFGALGHSVYTRELFPRLVEGSWSGKICHISTSGTHTGAITESGELYTWGRDEADGRLGLGPNRGPNEGGGLSIPSKVKALHMPVAAVSCGGFFTMALTEDGELWNWGANSNYELGRGDKTPKPVPSLVSVRIIQIESGGYHHSLALTDEGKVLSWGHGGHGQLGNSSLQSQKTPTVVEALTDERVIYIACGGSSSAAITDKGKLYMWGYTKDSQLGVPGLPEIQPSPVEVKFLMEYDGLGAHNVLSVAVGASHAMCLVSSYYLLDCPSPSPRAGTLAQTTLQFFVGY
ncbi:hypothetical protein DVH24_027920 [Malus domestica]|uniref:RCC1-like domain-containing protein n=1 Tax=Malus domestica TaxID=3750 RepID=A0A498HFD8_MALDO|nr:hypothetical protein DVH24_027920 [Malus domestica]